MADDFPDVEWTNAERFVDSILPRDNVLKVLDLKAGQQRFELARPSYVVGVDVIQAERGQRADADEHRVMDLEQIELDPEEYDVVLCINVLEHVRNPRHVISAIGEGLKPGGVFVAVLPNVVSLKAFFVRLTPHFIHRWFYFRLNRGSGDHPAPAVHSLSLRPSAIRSLATTDGWQLQYFRTYEGPVQTRVRHRFGIVGWRWKLIAGATRLLTFGLLTAEETGIIAILTKTSL
jgi:SAM-dependent methyltransferase